MMAKITILVVALAMAVAGGCASTGGARADTPGMHDRRGPEGHKAAGKAHDPMMKQCPMMTAKADAPGAGSHRHKARAGAHREHGEMMADCPMMKSTDHGAPASTLAPTAPAGSDEHEAHHPAESTPP